MMLDYIYAVFVNLENTLSLTFTSNMNWAKYIEGIAKAAAKKWALPTVLEN